MYTPDILAAFKEVILNGLIAFGLIFIVQDLLSGLPKLNKFYHMFK